MKRRVGCVVVGFLSLVVSLAAQTSGSNPASAQVPPPLIQFSNVATDQGGTTLSGVVSITFSLYAGQRGGEPLWTETQNNVQLDPTGHYSVQLGITKANGVPTTLFTSYAFSYPFAAYNFANNYAGCYIDNIGNINCTGTKNAVVPLDGGKRKVALSAIESPKNWFEDAGSAQLGNGTAVVMLDRDFIQTVNTEMDYKVFPVPNGDCKGLYVTHKTPTSFEVRELGGGTSNVVFDYRIMALRRKYEKVRFADHTNDPDPRKMLERMKEMRAKQQATTRAAQLAVK